MKKMLALDEAPALDLGLPAGRRMVAIGVVENIMGSMIGSVRKELKDQEKGMSAFVARHIAEQIGQAASAMTEHDLKAVQSEHGTRTGETNA